MQAPDLPARPGPAPSTARPRASVTDVVPLRTLVVIAVVVVLAVLGTVLALTLGDDGSDSGRTPGATASTGRTPADGQGTDQGGTAKDSASASADGSTAGSATSDDSGSAAGAASGRSDDANGSNGSAGGNDPDGSVAPAVRTYKAAQGFSIGLPTGWRYLSTDAAGVRFTGPQGQRLLVGWTSTPKSDPVADWENQERYMTRPQYHRIRIEKVGYRGWNTADWEFTYVDGGTRYRVVDRGFVVNSHEGYGLMYTAKAANWGSDLRRDTWRTLTRSFRPKR